VDGDRDVRVEEALHVKGPGEQGGLREVFVLHQRQERAVEVPVGDKNDDVSPQMRTKQEDACNSSISGSECAVVASAKAAFDTLAIGE